MSDGARHAGGVLYPRLWWLQHAAASSPSCLYPRLGPSFWVSCKMPPAKLDTLTVAGLSPVAGLPVVARFDGGQLSSDGGLLALREVERRLGIAERLAACIEDPRAPERVRHGIAGILRFRMLMIAAGYEDGNDADSLRRLGRRRGHPHLPDAATAARGAEPGG